MIRFPLELPPVEEPEPRWRLAVGGIVLIILSVGALVLLLLVE